MAKTWYHNISKMTFNIHDRTDLMDEYEDDDLLMKSEDGCAILEKVSNSELQELIKEYNRQECNNCQGNGCPVCNGSGYTS